MWIDANDSPNNKACCEVYFTDGEQREFDEIWLATGASSYRLTAHLKICFAETLQELASLIVPFQQCCHACPDISVVVSPKKKNEVPSLHAQAHIV